MVDRAWGPRDTVGWVLRVDLTSSQLPEVEGRSLNAQGAGLDTRRDETCNGLR